MSTLPGDWADAQGTDSTTEAGSPPGPSLCAWCGCRARAIPDEPPVLWEGAWYHQRGCLTVVRLKASGALPADYQPIEKWLESAS